MANHWLNDETLVIEEKTMLRKIGYMLHPQYEFVKTADFRNDMIKGSASPVYEILSTWEPGVGWKD